MEREHERFLLVAADELQGVIRQDVVGVSGVFLYRTPDFLERGIDHLVATGAKSHEVVEAEVGRKMFLQHAEVPFADQPGFVPGLLEQTRPGGERGDDSRPQSGRSAGSLGQKVRLAFREA